MPVTCRIAMYRTRLSILRAQRKSPLFVSSLGVVGHSMPWPSMAFHGMPWHALAPQHAVACHGMPCQVMPCHVLACHGFMACHGMPWFPSNLISTVFACFRFGLEIKTIIALIRPWILGPWADPQGPHGPQRALAPEGCLGPGEGVPMGSWPGAP